MSLLLSSCIYFERPNANARAFQQALRNPTSSLGLGIGVYERSDPQES